MMFIRLIAGKISSAGQPAKILTFTKGQSSEQTQQAAHFREKKAWNPRPGTDFTSFSALMKG